MSLPDGLSEIIGYFIYRLILTDYIIKKARLDDTYEIGALITCCWKRSYKDFIDETYLNSLNPRERADFITDALISGAFLCYCAWHNEKIIGACLFRTSSVRGLAGYGELSCLYVDGKYNNNGIGETLLNRSIDYMRSIGLNYVILNVLSQNTHAVNFYQKRGFAVITQNQVKLGNKLYPFFLMRKKIV